jgi:hypothetical protein
VALLVYSILLVAVTIVAHRMSQGLAWFAYACAVSFASYLVTSSVDAGVNHGVRRGVIRFCLALAGGANR